MESKLPSSIKNNKKKERYMIGKTGQFDAFFLTLAGLFNLNLKAISKMRLRAHGGDAPPE